MEKKKIDYKKRLKDAFNAIITLVELGKPHKMRHIIGIAKAQIKNLEGVENKGV